MAGRGTKKGGRLSKPSTASQLPSTLYSLRVNAVLEGGLRLSQLSALSLLEMSSSESLTVENGELLSTSSYLLLRLRDDPSSMETRCLREQKQKRSTRRSYTSSYTLNYRFLFETLEALMFLKGL